MAPQGPGWGVGPGRCGHSEGRTSRVTHCPAAGHSKAECPRGVKEAQEAQATCGGACAKQEGASGRREKRLRGQRGEGRWGASRSACHAHRGQRPRKDMGGTRRGPSSLGKREAVLCVRRCSRKPANCDTKPRPKPRPGQKRQGPLRRTGQTQDQPEASTQAGPKARLSPTRATPGGAGRSAQPPLPVPPV